MSSPYHDYDLLLEAPSPVDAALAKELLAEHGIPSFTHGRDRDLAELGAGVHNSLTRPDLFVPKGARERARVILDEAWSQVAAVELPTAVGVEGDVALEREVVVTAESKQTRLGWIAILALLVIAAVVMMLVVARGPSDATLH